MDFELTEEQEDIRRAAREFAEKEFTPELALKCDRREEFPWNLYRKMAKLGFTGLRFDEEWGGQGYGHLEMLLASEEFCRVDSTLGHALSAGTLGSDFILMYGSEEQKERYLPKVVKGEWLAAGGITEPAHGCDILTLDTTAERNGDNWLVNGTKTFITHSSISDYAVVVCQTNPELKHRGQTLFIVEKGAEGFEGTELKGKMGIRATPVGELSLNEVEVSKDALVGEENKGFYHTLGALDVGRVMAAGRTIGMAQGAYERALRYSKERQQFGQPISQFQAIQHKLAEMATQIEAARLVTYQAVFYIDKGTLHYRTLSKLCSMAKLLAADTAVEAASDALQIYGGYGYYQDNYVERCYRDVRITQIYEGTNEIQKNGIFGSISRGY
ncbi:MAG: acyl-CoA dehydrogenase family protein [Promethearchaeota archaeon]